MGGNRMLVNFDRISFELSNKGEAKNTTETFAGKGGN